MTMRFDERVYGPHPIPAKGRRVLLAHPGRDYNAAEAAAIRAAADGAVATVDEVGEVGEDEDLLPVNPAGTDSNDDDDGDDEDTQAVVHRGGGWYEVTATGERVHGRAKADEAAAAAEAGGGASG